MHVTSKFSTLLDSSTFSPVEESDDEETIDVEEREAHKASSIPRTLCLTVFNTLYILKLLSLCHSSKGLLTMQMRSGSLRQRGICPLMNCCPPCLKKFWREGL